MRWLLEPLESRRLLSSVTLSLDGGNAFAGATALGKVGGVVSIHDSLSGSEFSDFFSFAVRSSGNVNLTLGGLIANANLRLFDARGHLLAWSARTGPRGEAISRTLKRGTYALSVDRGRRAADTPYSLTLQADLNYEAVDLGGTNFTLAIVRDDGSTAPIRTDQETWVMIHGWLGSPAAMHPIGQAIDAASRHNQVLEVDWSAAAADANPVTVITRVPDVAAFVARKLTDWGIPHTSINLVGHSYGGYMSDQVAKRISGGVDRIVALDPATLALGGVDFAGTDFAAHSRFSLALVGSDYATASAATTADETINVNVGNRSSLATHGAVRDLFAGITRLNNGTPDAISALFSLRAIETGSQPFLRDGMGSGDEADLTGHIVRGQWLPRVITYVDKATRTTVTRKA